MAKHFKFDLFVSYSLEDEFKVEKFCDKLSIIGYKLWFNKSRLALGTQSIKK